jgi:hypothetical protein
MQVRRYAILSGLALAIGIGWATASVVAAAGTCSLSAPSSVRVGELLEVEGFGFPASSSVAITFTVGGKQTDSLTLQANSDGGLHLSFTPEAADAGATTIAARAGSACSASVVVSILGPNDTAPPVASPAGGTDAARGSTPSRAPTTDAVAGDPARPETPLALPLAFLLLAIGLAGRLIARPRRRH